MIAEVFALGEVKLHAVVGEREFGRGNTVGSALAVAEVEKRMTERESAKPVQEFEMVLPIGRSCWRRKIQAAAAVVEVVGIVAVVNVKFANEDA